MVKTIKKNATPQVSSLGRFKSTRGVISTPKPEQSGYVCVQINRKDHRIHRLMAMAFGLAKREDQNTVDHKDGNPSNNRLDNLRWANQSEQTQHSYATNESRASNGPRRSKPVDGRRRGTEAWTRYTSSHDAAKKLELNRGSISGCCRGVIKQTGGYQFRFGEANEPAVLEGEEWRPTHGGAHVSSLGRFKSTRGVISTPKPEQSGYVCVQINRKDHRIHRLMAMAFGLAKREDQNTVDHKDGNPSNNRLDNLRWANQSEQTQHSYATNESRASNGPRRSKPVDGRRRGTEAWTRYTSSHDAAKKLELNRGSISGCCRGVIKQTGGYQFRFGEANEPAVLEGEEWMDVVVVEEDE